MIERDRIGKGIEKGKGSKRERDRNISKTCVFIFHHSIQHDQASGYAFDNLLTGCDVIGFKINFRINPFSYMTKKSRQKLKYLENEKSF